jgi:hypothetical protein
MKVWFQMRITLNRTSPIKTFETVLTIESQTDLRHDILELLSIIKANGGVASKEIIHEAIGKTISSVVIEGVIHHLRNTGLLNDNLTLSPKSQKIIETGFIPMEERGEFTLWYLDDPMLTNHVIHYERTNSKNRSGVIQGFAGFKSFINKPFVSVLEDMANEFRIKKFDGTNPRARLSEDLGECHLSWTIDLNSEEQSRLFISGEIKGGINRKFNSKTVDSFRQEDYKSFLFAVIDQVKTSEMVWNAAQECMDVPFGLLDENDYLKMKTELSVGKITSTKHGEFEKTKIVDIPIRPLTPEDAKKWLLMLINNFLTLKYTSKEELSEFYISLKESPTFEAHSHVFDELTIEYVLSELNRDNSKNAYWNLQAPMDLYMDLDQKFIVQNRRRDIIGDHLTMIDFVNLIVDNDTPEKLVFSSKYVKNDIQIKKFELFAEAFQLKGVKDILLVTSDKVKTKNQDIRVETYEEIYDGVRAPHDRYFAYLSNGEWYLFKMSAELDQCRFSSNWNSTIQSVGVWNDISFMQIKREAFPAKLYEKLSSFEEVYQV